jgi:hypothetical protein
VDEKSRVLVTYGCHIGEDFAKEVGIEFKRLNLKDTVVVSLKGEKPFPRNYDDPNWIFKEWDKSHEDWKKGKTVYPEDLALLRRKLCAKYGIDLHDDSPGRGWALQAYKERDPSVFYENIRNEKYDIVAHMGYERARRLLMPFVEQWNKVQGKKECRGGEANCDCYFLTYRMHRPCKANVLSLEFLTTFPNLPVDEGVDFLKKLVEYLQLHG